MEDYYYITSVTTLLSAVLGLIFSLREVRTGGNSERTNALYLSARSAAIVLLALIPFFQRSERLLAVLTGAVLVIQVIDGGIGIYTKNWMRTAGPFFMVVILGICLMLLWRG